MFGIQISKYLREYSIYRKQSKNEIEVIVANYLVYNTEEPTF